MITALMNMFKTTRKQKKTKGQRQTASCKKKKRVPARKPRKAMSTRKRKAGCLPGMCGGRGGHSSLRGGNLVPI